MPISLKFSADNLIMAPQCRRQFLHINHPDAEPLRNRNITLASICELKDRCEVERRDPAIHVLIYTFEGQGLLFTPETPKKGVYMKAGELAILPAHIPHHYTLADKTWNAMWIYLADTPAWSHLKRQKPNIRISQTAKEIRAAVEGFLAESIRSGARARVAARHYAELIVLNIERELEVEENVSAQKMRQELYSLWESVSVSLDRDWKVVDLADEIGISPQHLYRVSMKFCNYKPMEMVKRLRMQRAQDMLSSTDYPIKIIARRVGYGDPFSFSAAFKRYMGCSPRAFRNRYYALKDHRQLKNNVI